MIQWAEGMDLRGFFGTETGSSRNFYERLTEQQRKLERLEGLVVYRYLRPELE